MILFPFVNVGRKRHENMCLSFQDVVSGNDLYAENGKPAPAMYLEAAKRLGMHQSECLIFEDALAGAQAGKSDGCHVVAVPDSKMKREPFVDVADEIIDLMWQFSGKRWGIPLEIRELRR